jgi:hypothetical protein
MPWPVSILLQQLKTPTISYQLTKISTFPETPLSGIFDQKRLAKRNEIS